MAKANDEATVSKEAAPAPGWCKASEAFARLAATRGSQLASVERETGFDANEDPLQEVR